MDQRTEPNNPNIIVNFAGNMAKLYPNKTYIVDAAHSLGAQHDFVNSEMTCFSLHPAKTITCGEGGVVATNHRGYYEILKKLREHGIVREPPFKHEYTDISYVIDTLGYNYRMTDIQAALALSQLSRLENYVLDRKNTLRRYTELIKDLNQESQEVLAQYMKPIERTENNSYNLNVVRLSLFREQRDKVFKKMRVEHNIGVTLHYPLIHKTELYKSELQLVGAEITEGQIMTLPLFYGMRDEEIFRVVKSLSFSILDVLKEYGGSPIIEKSTTSNETVDANYREVYNYNKTVDPVTNVTTYK